MTNLTIERIRFSSLPQPKIEAALRLLQQVWPEDTLNIAERTQVMLDRARAEATLPDRHASWMHLLWDGPALVAHARTFLRTIGTPDGPLDVMALAGVASDPARRGEGLGRRVVADCFARVEDGEFPVCLYQTGVPGFYEKLGARDVPNRFVNSTHPTEPDARPWWDPHIQIYPAAYPWPDGTIDLLGPGY